MDDHDIKDLEELKADTKRLNALEAQLKLLARIAIASLASIIGFAGSVIYKWQELHIDLSDLKGELQAHERWGEEAGENVKRRLDECHEDVKELRKKLNGKQR